MKTAQLASFLVAISIFAGSLNCFACLPAVASRSIRTESAFAAADAVFYGNISQTNSDGSLTVKVKKVWKGSVPRVLRVSIQTNPAELCQFQVLRRKNVLIYGQFVSDSNGASTSVVLTTGRLLGSHLLPFSRGERQKLTALSKSSLPQAIPSEVLGSWSVIGPGAVQGSLELIPSSKASSNASYSAMANWRNGCNFLSGPLTITSKVTRNGDVTSFDFNLDVNQTVTTLIACGNSIPTWNMPIHGMIVFSHNSGQLRIKSLDYPDVPEAETIFSRIL